MSVLYVRQEGGHKLSVEDAHAPLFADRLDANLFVRRSFGEALGECLSGLLDDFLVKGRLTNDASLVGLHLDFDRVQDIR